MALARAHAAASALEGSADVGRDRVEDSRAEGISRFGQRLGMVLAEAGGAPVDVDCLVTVQTIGVAGPLARRMEELQAVLGEGPPWRD